MTSIYDIEMLKEQKKQILERKKSIPKENIGEIKEVAKEYFRIQKKIQYYTDEQHRLNKIATTNERNKTINKDAYNEYHRNYNALKKMNSVC